MVRQVIKKKEKIQIKLSHLFILLIILVYVIFGTHNSASVFKVFLMMKQNLIQNALIISRFQVT